MSTSSYNVIAAYFHDQSDAAAAVRELQAAGFRSDQIGSSFEDLDSNLSETNSSGNDSAGSSESHSAAEPHPDSSTHHRSFWDKVKEFFSGENEYDSGDEVRTAKRPFGIRQEAFDPERQQWSHNNAAIPERYHDRLAGGGGLVTVEAQEMAAEAEQILTRNNGEIDREFVPQYSGSHSDFSEPQTSGVPTTGETGSPSSWTDTDVSDSRTPAASAALGEDRSGFAAGQSPERRIQLISEVLRVRKERVSSGDVRLRKDVKTETQNIAVPVTREEIVIERNPVSGQQPASGQIGADDEIRVPLTEERVQVDKVPVVREEVRVGKRPVSETRNVSDQVRREELEVEGADENISNRQDPNRKTA